MITHLLFDFFGTLVEYSDSRTEQGYEKSHSVLLTHRATLSYSDFLESWSNTANRFDLEAETSQDEYSMDDVVNGFLANVLGSDFSPHILPIFRDTYLQEWSKGVKYIEEVPALLHQLHHHYTLVLVTNTHSATFVHSHLNSMNITSYFSAIVTSIEHGKRKPCASIFEHALQVTNGKSDQAIYIGDSFVPDYLGANGIGMRCLLIDPDKKQNIPAKDRIAHVRDLLDVLNAG